MHGLGREDRPAAWAGERGSENGPGRCNSAEAHECVQGRTHQSCEGACTQRMHAIGKSRRPGAVTGAGSFVGVSVDIRGSPQG